MVAAVMLIAAGARLWHFAAMAPLGLAAVAGAIIVSPYRVKRILAFMDPYADPEGTGYHMIQSMVAVANGQVFGRGLGFGLQKFGYLPEDRTDFLFAVICEELGLMGATAVIALYAGLLWAGLAIIRREPNTLLKLAALGVVATVGLQAVINLAVVTGLGPTKGIALPLLSSGGTGWILTAASLGLLVAIDRTQRATPIGTPRDAGGEDGGSQPAGSPIVVTSAARSWPMVSRRAS
jgi:cell division protein FtsW